MSRSRRVAGVVAVSAALAMVGALTAAAAVVVAPVDDQEVGEPADAVVALAGDPARLRVAEEVASATGAELVLSWVPGSSGERDARCRDTASEANCFIPLPVSTVGEARAVGELAAHQRWDDIVVVTSRHHVGRAGLLLAQCTDGAAIRMVSATAGVRAADVLEESVAVVAQTTVWRAC